MQNKIPTQLQAGLKGSERSAANEYQTPLPQHYLSLTSQTSRHRTLHGVFSMFTFSSLLLHNILTRK